VIAFSPQVAPSSVEIIFCVKMLWFSCWIPLTNFRMVTHGVTNQYPKKWRTLASNKPTKRKRVEKGQLWFFVPSGFVPTFEFGYSVPNCHLKAGKILVLPVNFQMTHVIVLVIDQKTISHTIIIQYTNILK
jgi:hypothetical protein